MGNPSWPLWLLIHYFVLLLLHNYSYDRSWAIFCYHGPIGSLTYMCITQFRVTQSSNSSSLLLLKNNCITRAIIRAYIIWCYSLRQLVLLLSVTTVTVCTTARFPSQQRTHKIHVMVNIIVKHQRDFFFPPHHFTPPPPPLSRVFQLSAVQPTE